MTTRTLTLLSFFLLGACSSTPVTPVATVEDVELERFMGDWYVIASIPTPFEKNISNAVENYRLENGRVLTTFTYRKGGPQGRKKSMTLTGWPRPDTGNAVWDMQFIWPFKAEYRIVYLDPAYETTIIGRTRRDYAWIMSRSAVISEQIYQELSGLLKSEGYDLSKLRRVPQQW